MGNNLANKHQTSMKFTGCKPCLALALGERSENSRIRVPKTRSQQGSTGFLQYGFVFHFGCYFQTDRPTDRLVITPK